MATTDLAGRQPRGPSKDDSDQQRLIVDGVGETTGEIDTTTGEVFDPSDIVRSVGG